MLIVRAPRPLTLDKVKVVLNVFLCFSHFHKRTAASKMSNLVEEAKRIAAYQAVDDSIIVSC